LDDIDDCQSTGSFSMSRHSTRSRLMSPPTLQIAEFNLESIEKLKDSSHGLVGKYSKKSSLMEMDSDGHDDEVRVVASSQQIAFGLQYDWFE
jgi:hypothetical protein